MEEFTFDDDDVKNFIHQHFLFRSINISQDKDVIFHNKHLSGLTYAKEVGYNFYPTVLFLDKDGDVFEVSVGYKEEKEFLLLLKYIHSPEYDTLSFEEYKQQHMDKNNATR
jgi:thioredoxin-related protein